MALNKVKLANKKYRREARRKQLLAGRAEAQRTDKLRRKRAAKMMEQGRKEFNKSRHRHVLEDFEL